MRSFRLLASTLLLALVAPAASAFDVGRLLPRMSWCVSVATPWTEGANPSAAPAKSTRAADAVGVNVPAPAPAAAEEAARPRAGDVEGGSNEDALRPGSTNARHSRRLRPSGWRGLLPGGIH